MVVDRLLLISKLKKSSILTKYIAKFLFTAKTKSSLSASVYIFPTISQTCRNLKSMKFSNFLSITCPQLLCAIEEFEIVYEDTFQDFQTINYFLK